MENQFKGTPGPWRSDEGGKCKAHLSSQRWTRFARVYTGTKGEPKSEMGLANLALITAAPDLLEACIMALELSDKRFIEEGNDGRSKSCQKVYNTVKKAINKALGK